MAGTTKVLLFALFFLSFSGVYTVTAAVVEDHPRCLRELKDSLIDPLGSLKSWNNLDSSSVCGVAGVSCWINSDERVISLELQGMGLSGHLPDALKYCSFSLHHLNLSGNSLVGSIPSEICSWMPYLVTLDLSNNSFSGSIPAELGKCTYLNNIMLNNNELSGNIPLEISSLRRLKVLSLSNNDLSGSIAPFSGLSVFEFAGNRDLCGGSLAKCGGIQRLWIHLASVAAASFLGYIFGFVVTSFFVFMVWPWLLTKAICMFHNLFGFL